MKTEARLKAEFDLLLKAKEEEIAALRAMIQTPLIIEIQPHIELDIEIFDLQVVTTFTEEPIEIPNTDNGRIRRKRYENSDSRTEMPARVRSRNRITAR